MSVNTSVAGENSRVFIDKVYEQLKSQIQSCHTLFPTTETPFETPQPFKNLKEALKFALKFNENLFASI